MKSSTIQRIKSLFFSHETFITTALFISLWACLAFFLYHYQIGSQGGDSTFAAQIMDGLKRSVKMQTTFGISIVESMDHVWYRPAKDVCSLPLKSEIFEVPWGHFYLIMFALMPFSRLIDVTMLFALLQSLVYTSILAFAYFMARKKEVGVIPSILLVILASQHPLWLQGLLGQFYFNRLFIPFAGLLILLLEAKKIRYFWVLIAALFAASTNEIYGITIFLILLSFMWIRGKFNLKLLILSAFFLVLSISMTLLIQKTLGLKSTQTSVISNTFGHGLLNTASTLLGNLVNDKALTFFFVNIAFFGALSFLNLKLLIPLGLMLFPNAVINLGGAEKTGWSTHYHVGYFLPLIWLGILGVSKLNSVGKIQKGVLALMLIITVYINPLEMTLRSKPYIALWDVAHRVNYYRSHGAYETNFRQQLRTAVGDNSTVSAPEAIVYNLYDHEIYYYPMNIDAVDVVIFRVDETKTGMDSLYSINYGHQDPDLDICIKERMIKNGFDFDNPIFVSGWAIIKRK